MWKLSVAPSRNGLNWKLQEREGTDMLEAQKPKREVNSSPHVKEFVGLLLVV